jgi:cytosine/adenosine deaminase-related metal-dependent hydrolase
MRGFVSLIVAGLLLLQPAPGLAQSDVVAFTNVTVVPMDGERLLPDHTVVVRGDRIVEVGPADQVRIPDGARRLDGRGRYLMPGLSEMHAHVPGGQAPDADIEKVLAMYALNGVTTVRSMLGSPRHLEFRARAARGEILSPIIYTTGPSFNGNSAPDPATAERMVREQKAAGFDLMKIHPGVPLDAFEAMARTAREVGIRFAGHIPAAVGVSRALELGQWTIDHVDGYLEALVREGSGAPAQSSWFGVNLVDHLDMSRLPALVEQTRAAGTWIVPTQSLFESTMGPMSVDELAALPEMRYWPATGGGSVGAWRQSTTSLRQTNYTPERAARFLEARREVMRALHRGGVGFLLGSDAPQMWNVPGFSIQRELDAMVAAGFTPYEAYAMGSRNVAVHFGAEQEFGTVTAGRRADLVLLDANPLETVANWSRRAGVMVRGTWFDREEIDQRLGAFAAEQE